MEVSEDRMLRMPEVRTITGLGKTTIYRMIQRGEFPKPVQLGGRAVGWRKSGICEWIDTRPEAAI